MADETMLQTLKAELAALNAAVRDAHAKRTAWMDAHMADFARHPIGTEVFRLDTGERLGTIASYYRYRADQDGGRFDDSMSIDYRFTNGDNTSRHMLNTQYSVGDAEQLAARLRSRAESLAGR